MQFDLKVKMSGRHSIFKKMIIDSTAVESVHFKDSHEEDECCCWSIGSSRFQHESFLSKVIASSHPETKMLGFNVQK